MDRKEFRGYLITGVLAFSIPTITIAYDTGSKDAQLNTLVSLAKEMNKEGDERYKDTMSEFKAIRDGVSSNTTDNALQGQALVRIESLVNYTNDRVLKHSEDIAVLKSKAG